MGDMDSFGTGAATGPRGGKMRAPASSGSGASRTKPQQQINSVITEWKYPPQMPMVAKDPATVAMLTELGVGKIRSHAKQVLHHVIEDYRDQGPSAIPRMTEIMSAFHFYNHKRQDLWIAHFFLELNLYLDCLYQQREDMQPDADYYAVKYTIPPLMLHTNMSLVTAVSYAARIPHGAKVISWLIGDQTMFNDILGAAGDHERYRIQNIRSGVNYGMATQLYPKEQMSDDSVLGIGAAARMGGGGVAAGKSAIMPIQVQSPLWVAAVRGNIMVVKEIMSKCNVTGNEPSLFELSPQGAAIIARTLHNGPDVAVKDPNYEANLLLAITVMKTTPTKAKGPGGIGSSSSSGYRPHPSAIGGGAAEFGAGITGVHYPNPYYREPTMGSGGGITGIGDRGGGGGGGGYYDEDQEEEGIVTVSYATSADYYDSLRAGGGGGPSSSGSSSSGSSSGGGSRSSSSYLHTGSSSGSSSGLRSRPHDYSSVSGKSGSGKSSSKPPGSSGSTKKSSSRGPDYYPPEFIGK